MLIPTMESRGLIPCWAVLPIVIAGVAACRWIVSHISRFLGDLRLRDGELVVLVLGVVPAWRFPLTEVRAIHKTTRLGLLKMSRGQSVISILNRSGAVVLIEREANRRLIAVTPRNADEFIAKIEEGALTR
jgi:hypothetical protein